MNGLCCGFRRTGMPLKLSIRARARQAGRHRAHAIPIGGGKEISAAWGRAGV